MLNDNKFKTKKSLGQHFLTSGVVPEWMVEVVKLKEGETVLEVGPGTGILTRVLLERGVMVVALEADKRAILVLEENFGTYIQNGSLIIYNVDVRKFNLKEITEIKHQNYRVISNIPYYLSGMLFRLFLENTIQPTEIVFLVQKEVGERIACLRRGYGRQAKDKKESLLSLSVKAYGEPSYIKTVSKGHFSPSPKVDSAIIHIKNISKDNFYNISEKDFFEILHLGFGQKRKQLLGNLSKKYSRELLNETFSTLGVSTNIRAEDLSLKVWFELAKILEPISN